MCRTRFQGIDTSLCPLSLNVVAHQFAADSLLLSASAELPESRTARIFTFKLDLFANPPESLMYFIVLADRTFNFTVPVSVPRGIRGFRFLTGVAIFSNDAFDGQRAILRFTQEATRPLLQLL